MMKTCKDCKKIWTSDCPIRVFERNEGNDGGDVDPDEDYCSRLESK